MIFNQSTLRGLLFGVVVGISISAIVEYLTDTTAFKALQRRYPSSEVVLGVPGPILNNTRLLPAVDPRNALDTDVTPEEIRFQDIFPPEEYKPPLLHQGDSELSDMIAERIRVACFVMTQPDNHKEKALTVRATWGKRCNVLFFVSTVEVTLPTDDNTTDWTVGPPLVTAIYKGSESRDILWGKTKVAFQYAYDHYFNDADWFVKADDDTFIIVDNLRLLLLDKDPAYPIYYGCKFKPIVKQGYMSGGAGYVLSKEALKRLIEKGLPNPEKCRQDDGGIEDGEMGRCLESLGVEAGDSRDSEGQIRFFPFLPTNHVTPAKKDLKFWYWSYIWFNHDHGVECCSDSVISFHYVDRSFMWSLEYLIYHVHPFGIHPKLTGSHIKGKIQQFLQQKKPCNVTKTLQT